MSISIPDGLKAKMKAISEPMNWSAIAAKAFEDELKRVSQRDRERDVMEVIERLDPSYIDGESLVYQSGFSLGEGWARDEADATDLQRLDKHAAAMGSNIYRDYEEPNALAKQIIGDENAHAGDVDDWWSAVLGESLESIWEPEFVRGFVEGALAVWEVVRARG